MLLWREAPSHAIHEANPHDLIESNHKINQSINQSIKTLLIRDESETRTLLRFTCQLDFATWCTQLECIRLELVDRAVAHLLDRGDRDRRHGRRLLHHHRSHTLAQLRNYHDSRSISCCISFYLSLSLSLSLSIVVSLVACSRVEVPCWTCSCAAHGASTCSTASSTTTASPPCAPRESASHSSRSRCHSHQPPAQRRYTSHRPPQRRRPW